MTNNTAKYHGIIPAFYACYDSKGAVSAERVRALTRYFIDKGVLGVYACGSSGECIYQSVEERKLVLENIIAEADGKLTVIAHVAANNTADSMELAKHAEKLGVDAIAAIPPIYFKLPEHAIANYWNDISSAAPSTDFIIYNIPQLAGVSLTMPLFKTMLNNPKVIGVKNSSMPVQDIEMFRSAGGEDFTVFNGPDEQFISGRIMGAQGGIGGTYGVMPELFLEMDKIIKNVSAPQDLEKARQIQYAVNNIIYKMCSCHGNLYAAIKAIMNERSNIDIGTVRAPLAPLADSDMAIVKECAGLIDNAIDTYVNK